MIDSTEVHLASCPYDPDARVDGRVPTHECEAGHYFNENDLPQLAHLSAPLTVCPVFHYNDPDFDNGPCRGRITERDCIGCRDIIKQGKAQGRW